MAQSAARSLLQTVWGERGFPVDPIWIANQLGIKVIHAKLDPAVSGAIIKDAGKDPVIVLSETDSKVRRRFTCAHELGHYAQRVTQGDVDQYDFVDLRGPDAASGSSPDERFANQFAACLLMPEEEVRRLHDDGVPAVAMAAHFGVSGEAMSIRLNRLRLVALPQEA